MVAIRRIFLWLGVFVRHNVSDLFGSLTALEGSAFVDDLAFVIGLHHSLDVIVTLQALAFELAGTLVVSASTA